MAATVGIPLRDGLYVTNNTVDLHGVQISPAAPGTVFIIAQVAMFRGFDRGHHWEHVRFGEMFPGGSYCRDLQVAPDDPKTLYLAAGAGGGGAPPGTEEEGALFRSRDLGDTWERLDIGDTPPSRMFQIAIDRAAPSHVYCCTGYGHFYGSYDGGDTWTGSQNTRRDVEKPPHLPDGLRMRASAPRDETVVYGLVVHRRS